MTMMIIWAYMYDRDKAYDGYVEGCVDAATDRGWTDRAEDTAFPARPAVDSRIGIVPVSKAPPL